MLNNAIQIIIIKKNGPKNEIAFLRPLMSKSEFVLEILYFRDHNEKSIKTEDSWMKSEIISIA